MNKVITLIVSMIFTLCLTMNDGLAMEGHTGSVRDETAFLEWDVENGRVTDLSLHSDLGSDRGEELQVNVPERIEENGKSQESKTGKIIMTLLLTTLVIIGLSVMPMVMVSRAAKTRRKQSQQGKK